MSLAIGTRLGPYEIHSLLGAGGMGEVYLKAWPEFSPDGKWLAYASEETGRLEIYVMPFPGPGGKYQVSTGGGNNPKWSKDGRQLFFSDDIGEVMAVDVRESGAALQLGAPRQILKAPIVGGPEVPIRQGRTPCSYRSPL